MQKNFLIILFVFVVPLSPRAHGQELLDVGRAGYRLVASNVLYDGIPCRPNQTSDQIEKNSNLTIQFDDHLYYDQRLFKYRSGATLGFVDEDLANGTCRLYPMSALAESAGWFTDSGEKFTLNPGINGLFRSGKNLWMGTDGIGVVSFDSDNKTWSRFDLKDRAIPNNGAQVVYADSDYVFVMSGGLHAFSVKRNKWLLLKSVSTSLVREYGHNTDAMVQVLADHRPFSRLSYLPIDRSFSFLSVTKVGDGGSYRFEQDFSGSKTVFVVSRRQIDEAFLSFSKLDR